jgi:hypothetical protein
MNNRILRRKYSYVSDQALWDGFRIVGQMFPYEKGFRDRYCYGVVNNIGKETIPALFSEIKEISSRLLILTHYRHHEQELDVPRLKSYGFGDAPVFHGYSLATHAGRVICEHAESVSKIANLVYVVNVFDWDFGHSGEQEDKYGMMSIFTNEGSHICDNILLKTDIKPSYNLENREKRLSDIAVELSESHKKLKFLETL